MTTPGPSPTLAFDHRHEPVLVAEVVAWQRPQSNGVYVDATLGLGGHTRALLSAGAGRVVGIDRDAAALEAVRDWSFYPAIKHGRPVATIARAPVSFVIY